MKSAKNPNFHVKSHRMTIGFVNPANDEITIDDLPLVDTVILNQKEAMDDFLSDDVEDFVEELTGPELYLSIAARDKDGNRLEDEPGKFVGYFRAAKKGSDVTGQPVYFRVNPNKLQKIWPDLSFGLNASKD